MALLTPLFAASGAWVDSLAIRGNFKPVITAYHAICAQRQNDRRCERLSRVHADVAELHLAQH